MNTEVNSIKMFLHLFNGVAIVVGQTFATQPIHDYHILLLFIHY